MLFLTYFAEIIGELTFVAVVGQLWALPFLIYYVAVNTQEVNRWIIFTVTTLLLSYPNGKFGG
jgi:hypothetical protein